MSQGLTSTTGGDAASVFEGMELRTQFSPLFQLSDGAVVGASLELCGPQGTNFDTPRALRRTATLMEQRAVLDSRKFEFADTAAARHVADAIPLFVAVDIDVYDSARTVPYGEILTLMIEPRSILRRPQSRIAQVAQARRNGTPIALEGVTADRRTATLLTLIEPDIVLLHPDTLKSVPSSEIAHLAQQGPRTHGDRIRRRSSAGHLPGSAQLLDTDLTTLARAFGESGARRRIRRGDPSDE
ncbi:hypothetical protein [Gordonia otitidis]|uniref:EAL domain-containing protein n=1 Tax=Gordonia otitidis (strain DSM 44809 / CCUG 52243 / JCM 12355 / NBRC 100426 / IFM 10032) TaxID=1108044 RepID=H5TKL1_GORO1|nr:hypothetical protein [Gordonia otitidis]GAB34019.1 hypothetical protein GOOTI_091_00140 [Gordonia otitidis NBRC 100426]